MDLSNKKYHFIYRVTRNDGAFYIGRHSTDNIDDGYFGSGIHIKRSLRKHGKSAHKFEILEFLKSRTLLKEREAEIVNKRFLQNEKCLNIALGGGGGGRRGIVPVKGEGGAFHTVSRAEFWENRHLYQTNNDGFSPAINTLTGKGCLVPSGTIDGKILKHPTSGKVLIRENGKSKFISQEEFKESGHRGVNFGRINGADNPMAKNICIFDSQQQLVFSCNGAFKETCKREGLPHNALRNSHSAGGKPIFMTKRGTTEAIKRGFEKYRGWYAKEIK